MCWGGQGGASELSARLEMWRVGPACPPELNTPLKPTAVLTTSVLLLMSMTRWHCTMNEVNIAKEGFETQSLNIFQKTKMHSLQDLLGVQDPPKR